MGFKSASCWVRVWVWVLAAWVPWLLEEGSLSGHTLNVLNCFCASAYCYRGAHSFPLVLYPKTLDPNSIIIFSTVPQTFKVLLLESPNPCSSQEVKQEVETRGSEVQSYLHPHDWRVAWVTWDLVSEKGKHKSPIQNFCGALSLWCFESLPRWPQTGFSPSSLGAGITGMQLQSAFPLVLQKEIPWNMIVTLNEEYGMVTCVVDLFHSGSLLFWYCFFCYS